MNRQKLNSLVVSYKNGDEDALNELYREIGPLIESASLEVEKFIHDFTEFDCRVLRELKRLVKTFDIEKHDFVSAAKAIISRTKAQYIRRDSRKSKMLVSMQAIESPDDDEKLGFQIQDPLAGVEEKILHKERVTLLAQGDPRREVILMQWSKGANDKSISELLAQLFGGQAETHRKFILRFRTKCREILLAQDLAG